MVFPIIPLAALAAMFGGSFTLGWYVTMSKDEQEEADRQANEFAMSMFNKALNNLDNIEAESVEAATRKLIERKGASEVV